MRHRRALPIPNIPLYKKRDKVGEGAARATAEHCHSLSSALSVKVCP